MPTFTAKRIVKYGTIIIVTISLAIYVLTQATTYLRGPQLVISYPENGTSTQSQLITIGGNTQNVSFIQMNGNQIFANSEGNFSEKLLLNPGYNIITVNVTDRFERSLSSQIHITYLAQDDIETPDFTISTSSPLFDTQDEENVTQTKPDDTE